jgi:uncharacterized protein YkwD
MPENAGMKTLALLSWLGVAAATAQIVEPVNAPPTPPPVQHRELMLTPSIQASDFGPATTLYSIGSPTDEEQYYLELINRARANPTAEGLRLATTTHPDILSAIDQYDVDLELMKTEFAELPVRPPLAMNAQLTNAARDHSQYQFNTATQTHTGSGRTNPGARMTTAGYPWTTYGESVFTTAVDVFYGHAGFQIDWGTNPPSGMQVDRGHRMNNHGNFREVGVGVVLGSNQVSGRKAGPQVVTQDFATSNTGTAFVTGVAYYDMNGNSFYDPGEGIGGLTVNVNGASFHALTAASGGYAVPVPTADATRAVTFSGLGASGGGDAVISGGGNVKVDYVPAYVAPTLAGPGTAGVGVATNYTFGSVLGATAHRGRLVRNVNATTEGADSLTRVTVVKTGSYATLSTSVKDSGTGSWHMANPSAGAQLITFNNAFHVKAGAQLSFRSRLGTAGTGQVARMQASTDGGLTWQSLFSQTGDGHPGETGFKTVNVSLAALAGKDVRLRFNFTFSSGLFYPQTSDGIGWYIDGVSFTNLVDLGGATTATLPAGTTFAFTAPEPGDFLLAVSPVISGRDFGFGPPTAVTAIADPPVIDTPPVPLVGTEGGSASFTVAASHPSLTPTYAWKKNGVVIKNAISSTLSLPVLKLTDAANYTVVVSAAGQSVEATAALAVVKPVTQLLVLLEGGMAKPTVTLAGTPSLVWKKAVGAPPVVTTLIGEVQKTLLLSPLSSATSSAVYTCEASLPGGNMVVAGSFDLRVFNVKPLVKDVQAMPDGQVGSPYTHVIQLDTGLEGAPVSYSASGLPPGLKVDSRTGVISGVPTQAKEFKKIKLTAANGRGSTSAEDSIVIAPLPPNVEGTYIGTVARQSALNLGLGGRVDFTLASTGVITGSLTLDTRKLPFTSAIIIDNVPPLDPPRASIPVKVPGSSTPVTLAFSIDTTGNRLSLAKITLGLDSADISGWRLVWKAVGNPAVAEPRRFNYLLRPPGLPAGLPRGDGWGSFVLGRDGRLTLAGRAGDGEVCTCASLVGPLGEIAFYQALYTPKGSLLGVLDIDLLDTGSLASDVLGGAVEWFRPPNNKSRTYAGGIALVTVNAIGAAYLPPVAPARVLGMTDAARARLLFDEGGLAGAATNPDVNEFEILAGNKAKFSSGNPAGATLTITTATGLISGGFKLSDDELRTGTAFVGRKLPRTASFTGVITHDGVKPLGAGHFLLPEMPVDAAPPLPATTPATTAILSGSVLLEKK